MYEAFYGLREKPFSILPDPDLIFWGKGHRLALAMLEFGVMNNGLLKAFNTLCKMLIRVNVVQVCDARDDDSSNAAGIKIYCV